MAINLNIASKLIEATVWPLTLHMALVGSRRKEEGGRREGGGRLEGVEGGGREEGW